MTSQGCWKTVATKHLKSLTHGEISTHLSSNNYCPSLPAAVTTQVTRQIPRKGAGQSDTRAHASPTAPPSSRAVQHTPPRGRAGSQKAFILRPFPQVFQQFRNTWPRSAPASLITLSLKVFASMSHSFLISAFPTPLAAGALLRLPQPRRLLSRRDRQGPQGPCFQHAA